jgi:hypothetical protein
MTPQETLLLTRYVKACCPQQAMDDFTPDAWHDLLGDLTLADCRAAVVAVAKSQPFVAPFEIRAEVRRARNERIMDAGGVPAPPPELIDNPAAYSAALRAAATALADGRDPHAAMQAIARQAARLELEAS